MPKYGLISRIGQGAQGVLVKARTIESGEIVAIKRIHLKSDPKCQLEIIREISCLQNCNHENIVKLHDYFFNDTTASLVFEFIESTLKLIITDIRRPQNDALLCHYFLQLFSGIAYLHHLNIMHRDIKPENILVTINNQIKIADFGLACLYVPKSTKTYSHQVVTRWYRAPELLFGSITYDFKIDLWASGCILAEFINGSPLFMGCNDIDQLVNVLSVLGTPDDEKWPEWKTLPDAKKVLFHESKPKINWSEIVPTASLPIQDLITKLIQLNPSDRPTAIECVKILETIPKSVDKINYQPPLFSSKHAEELKQIAFARDLEIDSMISNLNELS